MCHLLDCRTQVEHLGQPPSPAQGREEYTGRETSTQTPHCYL